MRAGAVPRMGFVTSFRGGSETRPACHDAGLPGAGCPGGGRSDIRWRCHEARDRTEPWTERSLARAAVERRKASASAKSGARREPARAATLGWRGAVPQYAPFGAPPPLMCLEALFIVVQIARAQKKCRENGKMCPLPLPAGRESETIACPSGTGGCRFCNPWPLVVGVRRCESFASATENWLGIAGQNDGPGDNNHA